MSYSSNSVYAAMRALISGVLLSCNHLTHTISPAHQQRASQARNRANLGDSVAFRGSSTVFLICLLFIKRGESLKKEKERERERAQLITVNAMFHSQCFAAAKSVVCAS